jgi:hypothetical protein
MFSATEAQSVNIFTSLLRKNFATAAAAAAPACQLRLLSNILVISHTLTPTSRQHYALQHKQTVAVVLRFAVRILGRQCSLFIKISCISRRSRLLLQTAACRHW